MTTLIVKLFYMQKLIYAIQEYKLLNEKEKEIKQIMPE